MLRVVLGVIFASWLSVIVWKTDFPDRSVFVCFDVTQECEQRNAKEVFILQKGYSECQDQL